MKLILAGESTASRRRVFFQLVDATDGITAETGEAGGQPQIAINGDIVTGSDRWVGTGYIGTLTHIGNGRYYAELDSQTVATAGTQIETRYKSANTAECPGDSVQVVAFNPNDSVRMGLTALPNAAAEASGGLITRGTGTGQISLSSGAVTAGTVSDKTGYSLATAPPTSADIADAVWDETTSGHTTAGTYGGRVLRATNSNVEVQVTGSNHVAADVHEFQAGVITSADFSAGAIDANAIAANAIGASELAADAIAEIADGVWDELLSGHTTAGSAGKALSDAGGGTGGWALNTDQTTGLKRMISAIVGVGGETATPGVLEFDMIGETTTLRITQSTDGNDRLTVEEV